MRSLLLVSLAATLPAQERPRPHPLEPGAPWQQAVAAGTRTADGRPGPAHWTDTAHYELRAELSPDLAHLQGSAKLTYHRRGPTPLRSLYVHVRQNLHEPASPRNVRAPLTGGMRLSRWQVDGATAVVVGEGTVREVLLDEPLASGGRVTLTVDFAFDVPEGEAPRMGRDGSELFFLGYWYPQFAVCDDVRGWVAEPYHGQSEFYMPWADYDVAFTAPAGYLVQATGTLENAAEVLPDAALAALAQAATSPRPVAVVGKDQLARGERTRATSGPVTWRFRATGVRDFAIATCNRWLWDAVAADVGDRDGDGRSDRCIVHSFHRPEAVTWRRAARFAQHAIERMSHHVLPYPWPHASVVEGILGGGMEYPMLVLCGDQGAPFPLQSLIAHELAHQWFPMQVGNDENAYGWQDEGLVDFYTAILEREFWKLQRPSAAQLDYRSFVTQGLEREPLLRHSDRIEPDSYVFACYVKPAALLQQLGGLVGEERVLAALRDYATAWRYRHPLPEDFFAAMNRALGADFDWYWSTWWSETWTLDHAVAAVQPTADGTGTEVVVEDRGRAPHPAVVRVLFADGRVEERTVPVTTWLGGATRATLVFAGALDEVQLDPRGTSLDVDRGNDRWERR